MRNRLKVVQAVFAELFSESAATVCDWEQGKNEPRGPAYRIIEEMFLDPDACQKRFRDLASG
jgi:DNA-binding transcriptional regulator YiaG